MGRDHGASDRWLGAGFPACQPILPLVGDRRDASPVSAVLEDGLSFRIADRLPTPPADRSIARTKTRASTTSRPKTIHFPGPGEVLGGFRIVSELGRGAFARVYLAEQNDLAGRLVALKVAEALGDEPQTLARLQHAHIVPIHSVHDDPATGLRLLCMPYFGGANLAQILDRSGACLPHQATGRSLVEALDVVGTPPILPSLRAQDLARSSHPTSFAGAATRGLGTPTAVRSVLGRYWGGLPWWGGEEGGPDPDAIPAADHDQPARRFLRSHTYVQASAWIAARLAEGLEHAHARGLLHRDMKPSNVLIAADGSPMLLDFNLAAEIAPVESDETGRAMLGGTLPYMAPEHLDAFNPRGTTPPSAVDARSDLYALGLILFEMVAGRHPFDDPPPGLPLIEVVSRMTEDRRRGAPSARSINPAIPPSLDAILSKCLDPDPGRRHARAGDLAEDLQRFLDDRPNLHAPEPSVRERVAKWWRRHPEVRGAGPMAATGGVAILSVALATWAIADVAQSSRARLRFAQFHDEFQDCQLRLNTASGPASHHAKGVALAEAILSTYHVEGPGDWRSGPLVRRLPKADRATLIEEMSELLILLARVRAADAGRGGSEPMRRGAIESAVWLLEKAESIDPRPSAALYETRARLRSAVGEADLARLDRDRARATPPRSARDFYLRGTTRAALGQIDLAEADLGTAVAMDPRRFWAWFVLGLCHHDQGRYADAVGDFNACTLLAPDFAWSFLNRGLSLAAAGRPAEARASYDRALELSPDFGEALVDRALVCLEMDDPAQAERDLARVLARDPRNVGVLTAHAEALTRTGRRDRAEAEFAEALKARPDDARLLVARGVSRPLLRPAGGRGRPLPRDWPRPSGPARPVRAGDASSQGSARPGPGLRESGDRRLALLVGRPPPSRRPARPHR